MSHPNRLRSASRPGRRRLPPLGAVLMAAACPFVSLAAEPAKLSVRGEGTPDVWVSYGEGPAFGYGFCPEDVLARLPGRDRGGDASDPGPEARDFAAWAVTHGVTLAVSHPPFALDPGSASEGGAPDAAPAELLERAAGDSARFDPGRFRDDYFVRLRAACELFRELGIFVQLGVWDADAWTEDWSRCVYHPSHLAPVPWAEKAGPGAFVVDPESAPGLIVHQREHLRRVLDATGDLGNVFYELASGIGEGFGESAAWVETMLDEIEAWESAHGNVLVGLEDDGSDRPEAGSPASNPRLDVVFVAPDRPELHRQVRERFGKPTFAGKSRGLRGARDPAFREEAAGDARRLLWRMFTVRCQMACLPSPGDAPAYRVGPLAALDPATLPGLDAADVRTAFGPADDSSDCVRESAAERTQVLLLPRRSYFTPHEEPNRGWVLLECGTDRRGVDYAASTLRLTGLSYLGEKAPYDVRARILRLDTGEITEEGLRFRIDDLRVELPAFRDGLVVSLRQHFRPDFVQYVAPPEVDAAVPLRATVEGQTVTLEWDRNVQGPRWHGSVAWVQRLPGDEWLGCTPGTTFTDTAARPGSWVYMVAWRESPRSREAIRDPRIAAVTVPDVVPAAPRIVPLESGPERTVLWARGDVAADLRSWEWERRVGGGEWEPAGATDTFVREVEPPGGTADYRVRVVDAAGQAGPFSAAVRAGS